MKCFLEIQVIITADDPSLSLRFNILISSVYLISKCKKSCNVTQRELLVEFIRKNEELAAGRFSTSFSREKAKKLWKEIAEILNKVPGSKKLLLIIGST